jgi:hypothetical protein
VTPPDIIDITFRVIRVFRKLGIDYYITGSLASSAFGIARATLDVDIVADVKPEHISEITELMTEEFYIDEQMIRDALKQKSSFNLIHFETMFKVDVFILGQQPFDRQVLARKVQKIVSEDVTQQLSFATPEDIILKKLEWFKKGGGVSERQWQDVLGILKVQSTALDMIYLRRWAKEITITELLDKAIKDAAFDESQ